MKMTLQTQTTCARQEHFAAVVYACLLATPFVGAAGNTSVLQVRHAVALAAAPTPRPSVVGIPTRAPAPAMRFRAQGMSFSAAQQQCRIAAEPLAVVAVVAAEPLAVVNQTLPCLPLQQEARLLFYSA